MGDAKPKDVTKRNGNSDLVKEDCVIVMMPYVTESPVFTCPNCGTCQKVKGQKECYHSTLCRD